MANWLFKEPEKNPNIFWREFEEKTGEKVLANSLGKYLSGWEEFDRFNITRLWGLIIATSGGFRFHHFPQRYWFEAFASLGKDESMREKTLFLPKSRIVEAGIRKESKWWKKILSPSAPKLAIRYRTDSGNEQLLLLEIDFKHDGIIENLNAINAGVNEEMQ